MRDDLVAELAGPPEVLPLVASCRLFGGLCWVERASSGVLGALCTSGRLGAQSTVRASLLQGGHARRAELLSSLLPVSSLLPSRTHCVRAPGPASARAVESLEELIASGDKDALAGFHLALGTAYELRRQHSSPAADGPYLLVAGELLASLQFSALPWPGHAA